MGYDDRPSANEQTEAKLERELEQEPTLQDRRGRLTPEMEEEIERARQHNRLVAAIAGCSWGKNMGPTLRRAYADYCRRFDVDPVTEMDNLGGTPYVNSDWFLRKLGELRIAGIVKDFWLEHIHADPRLRVVFEDEKMPQEMRDEARRRWFNALLKRAEFNAPDEAEAICVCTITLPSGGHPIRGCKWAGNGTSVMQPRHGGQGQPNPIAEANPTLSVESQSVRRALRQLLNHISGQRISSGGVRVEDPDAMDGTLKDLGERVAVVNAEVDKSAHAAGPLTRARVITSGDGAYGSGVELQERIKAGEPAAVHVMVTRRDPELQENARQYAEMPDPYAEPRAVTLPEAPAETSAGAFGEHSVAFAAPAAVSPPGAPTSDLFGGETVPEPAETVQYYCLLCKTMVTRANDHDPDCPKFDDIEAYQ